MQDKTYKDIEVDAAPIEKRKAKNFPSFMFDSLIMTYGLKNIAVKNVV